MQDTIRAASVAALLILAAFLLHNFSGIAYGAILRKLNPHLNEQILMMTTLFRGIVSTVAIIGLGWLAGQVSWCARKSGIFLDSSLDRWINNLLGNLNVLPGVAALRQCGETPRRGPVPAAAPQ